MREVRCNPGFPAASDTWSARSPIPARVLAKITPFGAAVQQRLAALVGRQLLLHIVVAHPSQSGRGWVGEPFKNARLLDKMTVIPVTYGYARVSKTDDESRNLETQLRELAAHGVRQDLIFTDTASGRTMDRNGWKNLMARVQPEDTVVVAFLDRFSRNFEEGVAIQADLTKRDIAIVALREQIDTRGDSAAAKFFRRAMVAQGPYQVESASARIRMGLEGPGPVARVSASPRP